MNKYLLYVIITFISALIIPYLSNLILKDSLIICKSLLLLNMCVLVSVSAYKIYNLEKISLLKKNNTNVDLLNIAIDLCNSSDYISITSGGEILINIVKNNIDYLQFSLRIFINACLNMQREFKELYEEEEEEDIFEDEKKEEFFNQAQKIISDLLKLNMKYKDRKVLDDNETIIKNIDLSNLTFPSELKFKDAFFLNCNLSNSKLKYVSIEKSNLSGADLTKCNLENTKIRYSYLKNACFDSANLKKCDLSYCNLENTCFENAILKNAIIKNSVFNYSLLENSILDGINLENTTLRNSNILYVDMKNTRNINNVDFEACKVDIKNKEFLNKNKIKNSSKVNWFKFEKENYIKIEDEE